MIQSNCKWGSMTAVQSDSFEGEVPSNLMRMSLNVPLDIPEKLRELAGGKPKMGLWLTDLIRQMYDNRITVDVKRMDVEGLRLLVMGLAGQVQSLQGEMTRTQSQLAALIAKVES